MASIVQAYSSSVSYSKKTILMRSNQQQPGVSIGPGGLRYSNAEQVSLEEIMVAQLSKIIKLQEEQNILLLKMMEAEEKAQNSWIDPEEAAAILGLNITPSKSHRHRVAWLTRQGFITKFRPGRPPMYDRADVEACAEKIRQGKIHFPSTIYRLSEKADQNEDQSW